MSNEQLIADLKELRERMTPENWCPYGAKDGRGRKCVVVHAGDVLGAMCLTRDTVDRFNRLVQALSDHVPRSRGPMHDIAAYNDRPSTTLTDIQNVIDKTLADLGGL